MASLTIRNIDDTLKTRLRIRAAERGHAMEEEARHILRRALLGEGEPVSNLDDLAEELFGAKRGVHLDPHPRVSPPAPPTFDP
jgi:plasmid stability protein